MRGGIVASVLASIITSVVTAAVVIEISGAVEGGEADLARIEARQARELCLSASVDTDKRVAALEAVVDLRAGIAMEKADQAKALAEDVALRLGGIREELDAMQTQIRILRLRP